MEAQSRSSAMATKCAGCLFEGPKIVSDARRGVGGARNFHVTQWVDLYGNLPYISVMTAQAAPTRTARLEARLPEEVHALLKRAAELQGRSLTDFVVASAHEAAVRTIESDAVVRLSAADQIRFAEAVFADDAPADTPAVKDALKRAKKRHASLIESA